MMADPRKLFGHVVTEIAAEDDRIVVLSADSGKSSGFGDFKSRFPDRYFEFGIMEQGVTGIASGLATIGFIPVFAAIAPFVTLRNYEQFRNDIGYMNQNVKVVGRNGGFTYSDLGPTHHSLEDYAVIRMIPGVEIFAPQDPDEIRSCVKAMIQHDGPTYMRIGGPEIPKLFPHEIMVPGKARRVMAGSDVTVLTTGYISAETVDAVRLLNDRGVRVDLLATASPVHLDEELILDSVGKTGAIATVEEHFDRGGMGSAVAEFLAQRQPGPVKIIGVPHRYNTTSANYRDLLRIAHLDARGIADQVEQFLQELGR